MLLIFREQLIQVYDIVTKKFLLDINSEKPDFKTRPGIALKHSVMPTKELALIMGELKMLCPNVYKVLPWKNYFLRKIVLTANSKPQRVKQIVPQMIYLDFKSLFH